MKPEQLQWLSQLPSLNELLADSSIQDQINEHSRPVVKRLLQDQIDQVRQTILADQFELTKENLFEQVIAQTLDQLTYNPYSLRPVINGTGVVLHTNFGRSILSEAMFDQVKAVATNYSNLEYDIQSGTRGLRYDHVVSLLKEITGAEDALIVNNNAAAVFLVLNTFCQGQEVLISRGELVEIGGSFRIPEVVKSSGAKLKEVGATNKTHRYDYEEAIDDTVGAILKVHTSNFSMIGFTESVSNDELVELGNEYQLPVINDLGSGLFIDSHQLNLPFEPTVQSVVRSGCDLITFSGDKLLGGPQAGIIVGKREYIDQLKRNHLLRALRIDKLTLAALEVILHHYLDLESAVEAIPTLQMLNLSAEECQIRAQQLKEEIQTLNPTCQLSVIPLKGAVGGGSFPGVEMPSYGVAISLPDRSAEQLQQDLRLGQPTIVTRLAQEVNVLDVRTIDVSDYPLIAQSIKQLNS